MNIVEWISNNWETILAVYGGLVLVATAIVKATPSQKDDAILAKIIAFFNFFSTVNPNKKPVNKNDGNP